MKDYFANVRMEVIAPIPKGPWRILEVGCGDGGTGRYLKEQDRAKEVVGIEIAPEPAAVAKERLDNVLVGNIEALSIAYPRGYFDYLLLADVLEHLVDPWTTLRRLSTHLNDSGTVIASIPNVRNWRVVVDLAARGRWTYTDAGLLDRTHLRFFTKATMVEMFEGADLDVTAVEPLGQRSRNFARRLPGSLADIATAQYLIVARKRTEL